MADDWTVASQVKPQTPSDVIAPLTAYSNMQLAQARAREVGLTARQQDATFGARQSYLGMINNGEKPEDAIVKSGLSAIDPTGADQALKNVGQQRDIGAVRNYDPNNPNSLAAGGPALVGAGANVLKTQADTAQTKAQTVQTQAATAGTQADTQAKKLELIGQHGMAYLANPTPENWNAQVKSAADNGLITPLQAAQAWNKPDAGVAKAWAAAGAQTAKSSGIVDYNQGLAKAATTVEKTSPGETISATPAATAAMAGQAPGLPNGAAPAGTAPAYTGSTATGVPQPVDANGRAIQAPVSLPGQTLPTRAPVASAAPPASNVAPIFARGSAVADGMSPAGLARTAQIESSNNPNAANKSGASGLMQFMPPTWQKYGQGSPFDPSAAVEAAQRLAADNKRVLANSLGRAPSDAELYLAHQQGAGGASALLSNPNAPAASIVGMNAVISNGGRPDMTAGQFASMWIDKFNQAGRVGGFSPSGPAMGGAAMQMPAGTNSAPAQIQPMPNSALAAIPAPQPQSAAPALAAPVQPASPSSARALAAAAGAPSASAPVAGAFGGLLPAQQQAAAPGATAPQTGLAADAAAAPLRPVMNGLSLEQAAIQRGQGEQSVKQVNEAREAFVSASQGQQNLQQLQGALSKIPEGGGKGADSLLAPGSGAEQRLGLAKGVNTLMSAAGFAPVFDPSKISAAEESQKITGRLGFDLSRTLGSREAASIVHQAVSLNPGIENTPAGARVVSASLNAGLQRQRDFYQFQTEYAKQNGGSPQGAELAFDKAHPVGSYVQDVPKLASVKQQAIDLLQQHADDPRAAAAFDQTYGQGLSRYFLGAGR